MSKTYDVDRDLHHDRLDREVRKSHSNKRLLMRIAKNAGKKLPFVIGPAIGIGSAMMSGDAGAAMIEDITGVEAMGDGELSPAEMKKRRKFNEWYHKVKMKEDNI